MLSARSRLSSIISKRAFATVAAETPKKPDQKFKVVVVGAGPGGLSGITIMESYVHKYDLVYSCQNVFITVSSTISKLLGKNQVAVIEPSDKHYVSPNENDLL